MKPVHCPKGRGRYCRQRVRAPSRFDRRSLRTAKSGGVKLVVGCPKGKFHDGHCSVGMQIQSKLYPLGHPRCICRR